MSHLQCDLEGAAGLSNSESEDEILVPGALAQQRQSFVDISNGPHLLLDPPFTSSRLPPRAAHASTNYEYRETLRGVQDALHNADMALRNAQAAFRGGRPTHDSANDQVVDLTNISSDVSEDHDAVPTLHPQMQHNTLMTQTRHFGHLPGPRSMIGSAEFENLVESSRDSWNPHLPATMHHTSTLHSIALPASIATQRPGSTGARRQEETAVRRQAQARRDWARVERRNNERIAAQALRDAQEERDRVQGEDGAASDQPPAAVLPPITAAHEAQDATSPNSSNHDWDDSSDDESPAEDSGIMDAIDLTEVDDSKTLNHVLAKAQQDAIAAQNRSSQSSIDPANTQTNPFSGFKCSICMDAPTNLTTTICGHLFCHRCITDALKMSEQVRRNDAPPGHRNVNGVCPQCRKPLRNKEVGNSGRAMNGGLVGLVIKKVPRKQYKNNKEMEDFLEGLNEEQQEKEKGKQRAKVEGDGGDDALEMFTTLKDESDDPSLVRTKDLKSGGSVGVKRKRTRASERKEARSSVSDDSLFGSD